jgi:hypothetical protein
MTTFLLVAGGLVAAVAAFVVWRIVATVRGSDARTAALLARIEPVLAALRAGGRPDPGLVKSLAARADTRNVLFWSLHAEGRPELFPAEYRTLEAVGESDLVFWLLHPNELAARPDEIELVKEVAQELDSQRCRFLVFRFRTRPPHWAAGKGWMAGVAGPYFDREEPTGPPGGVFSELEPIDARTPEAHVELVVQRIYGKTS